MKTRRKESPTYLQTQPSLSHCHCSTPPLVVVQELQHPGGVEVVRGDDEVTALVQDERLAHNVAVDATRHGGGHRYPASFRASSFNDSLFLKCSHTYNCIHGV